MYNCFQVKDIKQNMSFGLWSKLTGDLQPLDFGGNTPFTNTTVSLQVLHLFAVPNKYTESQEFSWRNENKFQILNTYLLYLLK